MVYLGSLPEGISHHGREAVTSGHITKNPYPRNTDRNFLSFGVLYSLQEPSHGMELAIFRVYLLRSSFLETNHLLKVISLAPVFYSFKYYGI